MSSGTGAKIGEVDSGMIASPADRRAPTVRERFLQA